MPSIRDKARERYHSLEISTVWELVKVRRASALVVGAGALGNEVAKNLAMMGVRLIVVLDRDTVEVANLTRSVFFRESDHGRSKVEVLADRVRELNPDVEVLPIDGDLDAALGLGLIRRVDLIFSCLDNRMARRSLNRACQKLGKAWIDGSMENLRGAVGVFLPDEGPCYECNLSPIALDQIARARSCRHVALENLALGKVPTTSTMGSIVAALQVQEAMKLLHGQTQGSLGGQQLIIDGESNDFYPARGERNELCQGHIRFGEVTEEPSWSVSRTTALDVINRLSEESGGPAYLRLGRDVVAGMSCPSCGIKDELETFEQRVTADRARCPRCGTIRDLDVIHAIRGDEPWASRPLDRLGVPPLDILEARSADACRWYELTGDLASFPALLGAGGPE
jgi:molybdopterin/thiamine biosynthesis adenylyltransferase